MNYEVIQPSEELKPNYWFKTGYFSLWQNLSSLVLQCANNLEIILNFLIPNCSCGNYTYNTCFHPIKVWGRVTGVLTNLAYLSDC